MNFEKERKSIWNMISEIQKGLVFLVYK